MENNFGIDSSWFSCGLDINLLSEIMQIISKKRETRTILPRQDEILNALKFSSLDNIKVLIIGQDPYPSAEHASGFAFSSKSNKTPASLKNIFKKLELDFPSSKHNSNLLTSWARQGVMLLNTSLTFESKDSKTLKEHTKLWQPFIKNIFDVLIKRNKTLVVMCFGNYAINVGEYFKNRENIYILSTSHPSPFSVHKGFMTSNHFIKCNEILSDSPINWDT